MSQTLAPMIAQAMARVILVNVNVWMVSKATIVPKVSVHFQL